MTCPRPPRPPRSVWLTNLMLRLATASMSGPFVCRRNLLRGLGGLQRTAEEELSDGRIGEDPVRAVPQARAPELEHDAVIGVLERALRVLLDHEQGDAAL